jgi:hypothetical protein
VPVTDPLQGATFLPAWNDTYQIPQTIQDLYQFLLDRSIPRFDTLPDLEAAYPSPSVGKLGWADNLLYLRTPAGDWQAIWSAPGPGIWQDYTPTLTNVTLGNGTITGRYMSVGDLVRGVVRLAFGSTTSVSDIIRVSSPTAINLTTHPQNIAPIGNAVGSNTVDRAFGSVTPGGSNDMRIIGVTQGTFTSLSWRNGTPWTWASGHSLYLHFEYERAA